MAPIIHLKCRGCEAEVQTHPSAERVSCPHCNAELKLSLDESILRGRAVTTCVSCGHDALYRQKDFNRQLGMAIVGLGILISVYFFARSQPIYAMGALG